MYERYILLHACLGILPLHVRLQSIRDAKASEASSMTVSTSKIWSSLPVLTSDQWARSCPALHGALRHQQVIWDCTWSRLQQSSRFHPLCFLRGHPPQMTQSPKSLVFRQWSLDGERQLKSSSGRKQKNNEGQSGLGNLQVAINRTKN